MIRYRYRNVREIPVHFTESSRHDEEVTSTDTTWRYMYRLRAFWGGRDVM